MPKQNASIIEKNAQQETSNNKQADTGVNVKEMGFASRGGKHTPSLTTKQKKTRSQWVKQRQSWTVDDWMKVLVSWEGDESWNVCLVRVQ